MGKLHRDSLVETTRDCGDEEGQGTAHVSNSAVLYFRRNVNIYRIQRGLIERPVILKGCSRNGSTPREKDKEGLLRQLPTDKTNMVSFITISLLLFFFVEYADIFPIGITIIASLQSRVVSSMKYHHLACLMSLVFHRGIDTVLCTVILFIFIC